MPGPDLMRLNMVPKANLFVAVASSQPGSQKKKPAIVLAAPELSHRLMSGPPLLFGGSRELLLKQRGQCLHVSVFQHMSELRGGTKGDPLFVSSVFWV